MWLDHITSSFFEDNLRKTLGLNTLMACTNARKLFFPPSESVALLHLKPATLHPLPGDNSAVVPPDPIPNSEVKHSRADGSVAQAMQE